MELIVVSILSTLLGIEFGFRFRDIRDEIVKVLSKEAEVTSEVVTPLPPTHADVNATSSVVIPKSPAQLEFEEEERLRNL